MLCTRDDINLCNFMATELFPELKQLLQGPDKQDHFYEEPINSIRGTGLGSWWDLLKRNTKLAKAEKRKILTKAKKFWARDPWVLTTVYFIAIWEDDNIVISNKYKNCTIEKGEITNLVNIGFKRLEIQQLLIELEKLGIAKVPKKWRSDRPDHFLSKAILVKKLKEV